MNKLIRILTLTLLISCAYTPCAWSNNTSPYFTIKRIANKDYAIPLVQSDIHPKVAQRINQTIQMATVERLYNVVGEGMLFNNLMDENMHGVSNLDYSILSNTPSVLSIEFCYDTMGAYPDYHIAYLNFNAATGNILDLSQLFTSEGVRHLNDEVSRTLNASIKSELLNMVTSEGLKKEEIEEQGEVLFQLTECNATHEIIKFGIKEDRIIMNKGRCLPHVIQCYDINWTIEMLFKDLYISYFSTTGQKLLKEKVPVLTTTYPISSKEISIHGKIDHKYAFTMLLDISSDYIDGRYWYDKNGVLIEVRAKKFSQNELEIIEEGGKFLIEINLDGTLSGHWTNNQGKQFPITFQ
ncbi:hypothetical protein K5X82_03255 [Halosquirtibacter xylanolyticus]|uniref:hypothetical protein n=1 Tax=Halosquirtibacter xylanolyticus TaxID=3374599 RepID=UPI0037481D3F|nr:hypothetical protein K5X82_03255 [Prolixibacteraceae bacterium]